MDSRSQTRTEFNSLGISGAGKNVPNVGLREGSCESKKFGKVTPMFRPEDKSVDLHGKKTGKIGGLCLKC